MKYLGIVTSLFLAAPEIPTGYISNRMIANNAVTSAKLGQMPAHTYKGNNTGSTANALDITQAQLTADLVAFTSTLQGMTPASGGGTTNYLRADGTWAAPPGGTSYTAGTGLTLTGSAFSLTTPVTAANGGTGVSSLSALTLALSQFTATTQGVVAASGGGTTNFLRADGSWATPGGGGNVTGPGSSTTGHVALFNNSSGTLLSDSGLTLAGTNTGDVTIATFGSAPTANGATLSGQALTLQPADGTHPGEVSIAAQTFAGVKTFSSAPVMSGASITSATIPNAAMANGAVANLSGTNTGDQTITLTGNVTGSGTGSFATTIAAGAVSASDLANNACGSNLGTSAADISVNTHKLTSVTDPTNPQDAATKNYVDTVAAGLNYKTGCVLATAAGLPSYVYNNGSSGIGATITGVSFGALSIDGTVTTVGMRVLIKNETSTNAPNNGIYTVTTVGAVATLYVLTRSTDFDTTAEINQGDSVFIASGTANASTLWANSALGPITVGTTNITFAQVAGATTAITALTGDVTASGVGSVAATVAKINGATLGTTTATSGNMLIGNGSQWQSVAASGDCTVSSSGAIVCTKTNSVSFAPSATTDTTNASNITTGTLGSSELPALSITGDVSGSGTAGTGTVSTTLAGTIAGSHTFSGSLTLSSPLSMSSQQINFLANPSGQQDAATKQYVDTAAPILVQLIATSAISAGTYSNGTAGVGATFTETANGQLFIDSNNGLTGQLVLLTAQASAFQNGLYVVTQQGSASLPFILTRSTLFDTAAKMIPGTTFRSSGYGVMNGSLLYFFSIVGTPTITVGTTNLPFAATSRPVTISTTNGATPSTNGLTIAVSNTGPYAITGEPADATHMGMIAASGSQTLAPTLTLSNPPVMSGASITSASIPNAATSAASANTPSAIVARDGSGNFTAGTITAALTGTASGNLSAIASAHGTLISGSGNTANVTAPGTSGWVLTSNGASADPTYQAASGGITALSGDVTASGTGSVAATVAQVGGSTATNVHSAELAANAATASNTASKIAIRDSNGNFAVNALEQNLTSTATAAGTTMLTVSSAPIQEFTGTTTQTVVLPNATTLVLGQPYRVRNNSTGAVTVNANGGTTLATVAAATEREFDCTSLGTSAGSWSISQVSSGSGGSSPTTTKGDLAGYSTTSARVPVGADGLAVVADSTQTLGLKYSVPGASPAIARDWFEDFVSDTTAGQLNITNAVSGTGATVALTNTNSTFDHVGNVTLSTGTTTTGSSGLYFGKATSMWKFSTSQGVITIETEILTPAALSNGTNRYWIANGFDSSAVGAIGGAGGLGFLYSDSGETSVPNISVAANGNWQGWYDDDSAPARGVVDTGVTVVANTWYDLKMTFNRSAASVTWCANGTCVTKTGGLTIPFGAAVFVSPLKIEKALGTTATTVVIDWFHMRVDY